MITNDDITRAHQADPSQEIKLGLGALYFEAQLHARDFLQQATEILEDRGENYTTTDAIALAAVMAQIQASTMHKVGLQQLGATVDGIAQSIHDHTEYLAEVEDKRVQTS